MWQASFIKFAFYSDSWPFKFLLGGKSFQVFFQPSVPQQRASSPVPNQTQDCVFDRKPKENDDNLGLPSQGCAWQTIHANTNILTDIEITTAISESRRESWKAPPCAFYPIKLGTCLCVHRSVSGAIRANLASRLHYCLADRRWLFSSSTTYKEIRFSRKSFSFSICYSLFLCSFLHSHTHILHRHIFTWLSPVHM